MPAGHDLLALRDEASGELIARRVTNARSFWARFRGLMGRPALAPDEGLFLSGSSSIHMLFMRFPIDCLFVGKEQDDGSRRVVAVRQGLPPWRGVVWWVRGADGVVELPAGTLERARIELGRRVRFEVEDTWTVPQGDGP
jgi:uncharacterized membrane protein (UPF0127 family)